MEFKQFKGQFSIYWFAFCAAYSGGWAEKEEGLFYAIVDLFGEVLK